MYSFLPSFLSSQKCDPASAYSRTKCLQSCSLVWSLVRNGQRPLLRSQSQGKVRAPAPAAQKSNPRQWREVTKPAVSTDVRTQVARLRSSRRNHIIKSQGEAVQRGSWAVVAHATADVGRASRGSPAALPPEACAESRHTRSFYPVRRPRCRDRRLTWCNGPPTSGTVAATRLAGGCVRKPMLAPRHF